MSSLKSVNLDIGTCRGKAVCRHRERIAICKQRTKVWTRCFPHSPGKELTVADTWILDFWSLELGDNAFPSFESLRLWHFAGKTLAN